MLLTMKVAKVAVCVLKPVRTTFYGYTGKLTAAVITIRIWKIPKNVLAVQIAAWFAPILALPFTG